MDDPRHARLRRLVSSGFTPKELNKLVESVRVAAVYIVDDVAAKGAFDFVSEIAAELPLLIICDISFFFFLMIRRPPRSTRVRSSAASDVYKRQMYARNWKWMAAALNWWT